VLDAIYSVSWTRSPVKPVMMVSSCGKLTSGLQENDLQGFPNEEVCKSQIIDKVYAMKRF
jgi:hypothetical protein